MTNKTSKKPTAKKKAEVSEKPKGFALSDLTSLTDESGVRMPIKNPVNPSEDLTNTSGDVMAIWVVGMDTQTYKSAMAEFLKQFNITSKEDLFSGDDTMEKLSKMSYVMARCSVKWENIEIERGKIEEYDVERAEEIYTKHPFILMQLEGYVHKRANFLKK